MPLHTLPHGTPLIVAERGTSRLVGTFILLPPRTPLEVAKQQVRRRAATPTPVLLAPAIRFQHLHPAACPLHAAARCLLSGLSFA